MKAEGKDNNDKKKGATGSQSPSKKSPANPSPGYGHGAATGKSAASVMHDDPTAEPHETDKHTIHGAKLLSAIATAHINHLNEAETKKKLAKGGKRKPGKGVDYDEATENEPRATDAD